MLEKKGKAILKLFSRKIKSLISKPFRRHGLVGPPELWKMKRQFQFNFLKSVGLKPHHYLLDVGCGTLRGGIPLIRYLDKSHYYGVEIRDHVLDEGKKELRAFKLERKKPVLVLSELSSLKIRTKFDFIWAFSVLIHMIDEILDSCIKMVSEHLKKSGVFYANVNIGKKPGGKWKEFPHVWRSFTFYKAVAKKYGLVVTDLGELSYLGHVTNTTGDESHMLVFGYARAY